MKKLFYIGVIALIVTSCATGQYSTGVSYEDDLYYNPKEKPLAIQEVEAELPDVSAQEKRELLEIAKESVKEAPEKYPDITNVDRIEIESVEYKTNPKTGAIDTIIEIMSQGYWINGFEGSKSELEEAMRVIDQYPNGFGYFGQGYSIGENLSFDSDWNVYTRDGKYWWFPRVTNLTMYNQFMFGRYPRYEWTIIWDSPHYDYWDFDFHFGHSSYWRWRNYSRWHYGSWYYPSWRSSYWHSPSWHFGVGFGADPWYYHNRWYDYPYYRRHYSRHSNPNWRNNNYRYGPRKSMFTKTVRSNSYGTVRSTSGLKSITRGTRGTTTTRGIRSTTTRGNTGLKTGTGRVSTRGTGTKSRYRSTGGTLKTRSGSVGTKTGRVTTRSRYSTQKRGTKTTARKTTTTQSRKSTVRRYSKPRSTTRPTYNRSKTKSGSTYNRGSSKTRTNRTYKKAPSRSSSSTGRSSGSYNRSSSSKSRTYNPSSSSRSRSSSTRSSSSRSSSSSSRSSSSSSRSRTR